MGKSVSTSVGDAELDVLLTDGTIIEAKSGQTWNTVGGGSEKFKKLDKQIKSYKAYHSDNGIQANIEIAFEVEPSNGIKQLLNDNGVKWWRIP